MTLFCFVGVSAADEESSDSLTSEMSPGLYLSRSDSEQFQLKELTWSIDMSRRALGPGGKAENTPPKSKVWVEGEFRRKDWILLFRGRPLISPFRIFIPRKKGIQRIRLTAVGPMGDFQEEVVQVVWVPSSEERGLNERLFDRQQVGLRVSTAYTSIQYNEGTSTSLTPGMLTVGASYHRGLFSSKRWESHLSGYFTLLQVAGTDSPS